MLQESPETTKSWKKTMKVVVTGAAGAIANHLLFMLASGEVFGRDQPIQLQLLGTDRSRGALEGVAMELEDRWELGFCLGAPEMTGSTLAVEAGRLVQGRQVQASPASMTSSWPSAMALDKQQHSSLCSQT
jgi:hypothetical protein